ncbi:MAG: type II toxin-antitoxin system VapC family toxin [Bifidobacteriaceae bacterium]|jgi:predicted nucleic acid-binding protein|nr:type II toxin-antitoxin system VapC family toxin [Bifidobacteriaceae bacterium]
MVLVDTDVLINHLRGHAATGNWLEHARTQGPLEITVVTVAELIGGMRSVERQGVWRLLSAFQAVGVSELAARRAGGFMHTHRRSHSGITLGDYLIAATTVELGADPATMNVKHFPMFSALRPPVPAPQ